MCGFLLERVGAICPLRDWRSTSLYKNTRAFNAWRWVDAETPFLRPDGKEISRYGSHSFSRDGSSLRKSGYNEVSIYNRFVRCGMRNDGIEESPEPGP